MSRKLAAVLAADIVGYSKLVSEDEASALAALRDFRVNSVRPFAAQHRGEIVKSMGDGWLIAFASAQDAVSCAIKLQGAQEEHDRIKLRIGVHIGDVTREDEDIFGDGVNVAARLEALAPSGGVALSDAAYAMLDGTLRPGFANQGEQTLKNIDHPVRVWMRAPDGARITASTRQMGFPRLTVQPVQTKDDRADVIDLAEGLGSDIGLYLNAVAWLETGAGYELTQNLRARGERLRLECRLAAPDGNVIWSAKHDGILADSFEWQDQIGEAVASDVLGVILNVEGEKLRNIPQQDLTAQQCSLLGKMSFRNQSEEHFVTSIGYHALAIEKDPTFGLAYANALFETAGYRTLQFKKTRNFIAKIPEWSSAARAVRDPTPLLDVALASVEYQTDFDASKLRPVVERAVLRAPFDVEVLNACAWGYIWMGDPVPALSLFQTFRKLGRLSPYWNVALSGSAAALVQSGRFEEAIELAQIVVRAARDYRSPYMSLASAFAHLGKIDEARAAVEEIRRLAPTVSVSIIRATSFYGGTPEGERYLEGLRLAGLPE